MLYMCWLINASPASSVNVSVIVLELVMVCYFELLETLWIGVRLWKLGFSWMLVVVACLQMVWRLWNDHLGSPTQC